MKKELTFIKPLAYTTDGIIVHGFRKSAIRHVNTGEYSIHSPTKYQMIMNTGQICDLSIQHCEQIDEYLQKEQKFQLPNDLFKVEETP